MAIEDEVRQLTERVGTLEGDLTTARTAAETERAAREAAESRVAAAETRVAVLEGAAQIRRFTDIVAGQSNGGHAWIGDRARHVATLQRFATAFEGGEDSQEFKDYVIQQDETAKQLHTSGLFRELGTSQGDDHAPDNAEARFAAGVKKYREAHPDLTEAKAYAEFSATAEGSKLYNESVRRQPAGAGV